MSEYRITEEQFLAEVSKQGFALHAAAVLGDLEKVRRIFTKIEALNNAYKDRERLMQTQKIMSIAQEHACEQ